MPAKYNSELVDEKFRNVHKRIDGVHSEVDELEKLVKDEYTPISTTTNIDTRVKKFEGFWDWGIRLILAALIAGILAILGLGRQ